MIAFSVLYEFQYVNGRLMSFNDYFEDAAAVCVDLAKCEPKSCVHEYIC